tara:strand:+ start:451 stop:870 length:420 start_codon:yes stop_codon:yes gene_type:complete
MPKKTKEEKALYRAEWYEKNKEEITKWKAEWYKQNKEKIIEKHKVYSKEYRKTPAGIRSRTIANWKTKCLTPPEGYTLHELYDEIYLPCEKCMVCNKAFKSRHDKCSDHSHDIKEHNYRQVLCQKCNNHDNWKKHSEWV